MAQVKAHTRKTKSGMVRVKAHTRAVGDRYAIFAKLRGKSEGVLWDFDKSGKKQPLLFKHKRRARERAEIWKRAVEKQNLKGTYVLAHGTKTEKVWEGERRAEIAFRRLKAKLRGKTKS